MNEEEKKAVENIKELKTLFEIDDKKDFEATPLVQKEIAKDLKILLNIIDKMKNCINILDDELKERNKTINKKGIIIEKLQKENEELTISNKEIDKECSRLEKKEVELINENEHYEDLIYALKTYYDITEEDLEKCMKNDR